MAGEAPHPRLGTVLEGKWSIEGLLGEGGTGSVFVAKHTNESRVAVKILHARLLDHPTLVTRFRREGSLANRVDHPDVVRVFDDGVTVDGCPFLVTELLEGETLEQERVRTGGTLGLDTVLELGLRLCDIVQAAHEKGILHRDIKPQNLFRTRKGELKVLDFGLGCESEPTEEGVTSVDTVLGTVGFMSPEQAQGRWDLVDEQTDVWAIGATLLKLATGLDAHEGATSQERLALAATTPVRRLEDRVPAHALAISRVLQRAMAFSRGERFSSARLLGEALAEARVSPPSVSGYPPVPPVKPRSRKAPASFGAVALVVLLGMAWFAAREHRKQETASAPTAHLGPAAQEAKRTLVAQVAPRAMPPVAPPPSEPSASIPARSTARQRPQTVAPVKPDDSPKGVPTPAVALPSTDPMDRRR